MTKIAVISDIHGNREALNATLHDIAQRDCNQIICLGDIVAKGKFVNECVSLIKEHCDVSICGNCDDYFAKDRPDFTEIERRTHDQITPASREYLLDLPSCHEIYMSGRLVRFFHAGPDSMYDYNNNSVVASIDRKYRMFEPGELTVSDEVADVVVYGHIHTQLMNKLYNRTLICCGSVGNSLDLIRDDSRDANPLNTTMANYIIIEGELDSREYSKLEFNFIQVPYDIDKELAASDTHEDDYLSLELRNGQYRDTNKLKKILAGETLSRSDKKLKYN